MITTLRRYGSVAAFGAVALALMVMAFGLGAACAGPDPVYVQRTDTVRVPIEVIREREPDTVVTFRDRIVSRALPPETVLVATGPIEPQVTAFCAPSLARARGDSVRATPSTLMIRSLMVQRGMFFAPDRLSVTAPVSTGGAMHYIYRPRPGYSVVVAGDSLALRESRWWLLREGFEAAVWAGIGYGVAAIMR